MLYIALQSIALLAGLVSYGRSRSVAKTFGFLVIAAFAGIASLRGAVGTDTHTYINLLRLHMQGATLPMEPGFLFFADIFAKFTDDPNLVVNLYAALFYAAVLLFMLRATRREMIYLLAFFGPQYFLMYSMNGIRVGLATAFFLLFFQFWNRERFKTAIFCGVVAFGFHYSVLIAVVLFFFGRSPGESRRTLIVQLSLIALLILAYTFLQDYVLQKFEDYVEQDTFSPLAGLSIVIKAVVFLGFVGQVPIPRRRRYRTTAIAIVAIAVSIAVTQFSYAGLRLLDIVGWILPLLYMGSVAPGQPMGRRFSWGLLAVGVLGALAVLRNIYSGVGVGQSPFIPYQFIWDTPF